MKFEYFSFGKIRIDGTEDCHDIVIDRGEIRERKKKASKKFSDSFGHTPLFLEEEIPWTCRHLVVGTGTGPLPIMDEVRREAQQRKVEMIILPTGEAPVNDARQNIAAGNGHSKTALVVAELNESGCKWFAADARALRSPLPWPRGSCCGGIVSDSCRG